MKDKIGILASVVVSACLCGFAFWIGLGLGVFAVILAWLSFAIWNAVKRRAKKWKITVNLTWGLFLCFVFLNPVSLSVIRFGIQVNLAESLICRPKMYLPAGETLALYCQSFPVLQSHFKSANYGDYVMLDRTWLPEEFHDYKGSPRITIFINNGQSASVEFGGGFHHFGYSLALDSEASSPATNVWHLSMYSEGRRAKRHLTTFHTDANRQFAPD